MPGGTRSRIRKLRRLTQAGRARKDSPAWSSLRWLRWNASASTTPSVTLKKVPAPLLGEPARAADRAAPVTPAGAELPSRSPTPGGACAEPPSAPAPGRRPGLGLLVDEPQLDERVVAPLVDREGPVLEDAVLERPVLVGVLLEGLEGELDLPVGGVDQGLPGTIPRALSSRRSAPSPTNTVPETGTSAAVVPSSGCSTGGGGAVEAACGGGGGGGGGGGACTASRRRTTKTVR